MNDFIDKVQELADNNDNITINIKEVTCDKRIKEINEYIERNRQYIKELMSDEPELEKRLNRLEIKLVKPI